MSSQNLLYIIFPMYTVVCAIIIVALHGGANYTLINISYDGMLETLETASIFTVLFCTATRIAQMGLVNQTEEALHLKI